jgi:hypothetical protein
MSDEPANSVWSDGQEIDPGEPVGLLTGFEHETSPTFLTRIRRTIHRRTAASQIASFSWNVPSVVLLELWTSLMELLHLRGVQKGRQS